MEVVFSKILQIVIHLTMKRDEKIKKLLLINCDMNRHCEQFSLGYVFKPVVIEEKTQIKVWLTGIRSPNFTLDIGLG